MSDSVDQRVVEMQFNNAQFEKGVSTTINSIGKLKDSLNFDGSVKSLEQLEKAGRSFSLDGIGDAIDNVRMKFSFLDTIAFTTLDHITRQAVSAGEKLVKSLSVDQISSGLSKYELKTSAVQTIINSTGKSLEVVNQQLDKLNWYTDETSYNFTDMLNNIGNFTSMGIELEPAVTAMIGISNATALAGKGTAEASHAMYGFSKAIAQGKMTLNNWNIVSRTAGVGNQQFKETAIEVAKSLGTIDEMGRAAGDALVTLESFDSSLAKGWFTKDVLMETLKRYGDFTNELYDMTEESGKSATEILAELGNEYDSLGRKAFQAGQEAKTFTDAINAVKDYVSTQWSKTFEIIFGSYEEAKVIWTGLANTLSDIFGATGEVRNQVLEGWKSLGGRADLIQGVINIFRNLSEVLVAVRAAFADVIPAFDGDGLARATSSFVKFTESLRFSEESLKAITEILRPFARVIKGIGAILVTVGKVLLVVVAAASKLLQCLLTGASRLGEYKNELVATIRASETWSKILDGLSAAIKIVAGALAVAANAVIDFIKNFNGMDSIAKLVANAVQIGQKLVPIAVETGLNVVKGIIVGIRDYGPQLIQSAITAAKSFLSSFDKYMGIHSPATEMIWRGAMLVAGLISGVLLNMSGVSDAAKALGQEFLSNWNPMVLTWGSKISGMFQDMYSKLQNFVPKIIRTLRNFYSELTAGKIITTAVAMGFLAFGKTIIQAVGSFIKLFDAAVEVLGNFGGLIKGIKGAVDSFSGVFKELTATIKKEANIRVFKQFAISMLMLAGAIAVVCFLPYDKLKKAIPIILGVMAALTATMWALSKLVKIAPELGKGFALFIATVMSLSMGVLVLAGALKLISSIDFVTAMKNSLVIVELLAVLATVSGLLATFAPKMSKGALTILAIAFAVKILVGALLMVSDAEASQEALLNLVAIMAGLAAISLMSSNLDLGSAVGILAIVGALYLFVDILNCFRDIEMPVEKLAKVVAFIALFIGIVLSVGYALKMAGNSAGLTAIGIAALVASLWLLADVFERLKEVTYTIRDVINVGGLIAGFISVIALLALVSNFAGDCAKGFVGIALAVAAITGSLWILTKIDNAENLLDSAVALSAVLLAFGAAVKWANNSKGTAAIVAMVMSIVAISATLMILSEFFDPVAVLEVAGALSVCLLGLGAALYGASKIAKAANIIGLIAMMFDLIVVAGALGYLTYTIKEVGIDNMLWAAVALMTVMGAFAAIANGSKDSLKGALIMLLLSGVIGIVAVELGALAKFTDNAQDVLAGAISIGLLMLMLAGSAVIANKAWKGALTLLAISGVLAIVTASMSNLAQAAGDQSVWSIVWPIMALVGALSALSIVLGIPAVSAFMLLGEVILLGLAVALGTIALAVYGAAKAIEAFSSACTAFATALGLLIPLLPQFGESVAQLITNIATGLIQGAVIIIEQAYPLFYQAGYNVTAGFLKGAIDGLGSLWNAGLKLAQAVLGGFRYEAEIHSPSAKAAEDGKNVGLGYLNGATDSGILSNLFNSGEGMANSVLGGLGSKLENFKNMGFMSGINFADGFQGVLGQLMNGFGFGGNNSTYDVNKLTEETELYKRSYENLQKLEAKGVVRKEDVQAAWKLWHDKQAELSAALVATKDNFEETKSEALELDDIMKNLDLGNLDGVGGGGGGGGSSTAKSAEETKEAVESEEDAFYRLLSGLRLFAHEYAHIDKELAETVQYYSDALEEGTAEYHRESLEKWVAALRWVVQDSEAINESIVQNSIEELRQAVSIAKGITDEIPDEATIKVLVDTSEAENQLNGLKEALSYSSPRTSSGGDKRYDSLIGAMLEDGVSASDIAQMIYDSDYGETDSKNPSFKQTVLNYTQNITSPNPSNPVEIYRRTNQALNAMA